MRYLYLALFAVLAFGVSPARAQTVPATQVTAADIQKAESYLKALTTARADFIQIAPNGQRLSGQFFLDRPGKLRFNYNEVKDFVVADGLFIYFYDSQLGEQSNAPIGQTLADFLLRKDLKLSGDVAVQKAYNKDGFTYITIAQVDDVAAGQVELIFSDVPYALNRWRVTDAQGGTTEIILKNLQRNVSFPGGFFAYKDPKGRKVVND